MHYHYSLSRRSPNKHPFLFATGIEGSYPTINTPDKGRVRVDEFIKTRHDRLWREDFSLVKEMGLEYLRYGHPYYRVHTAPQEFDWAFVDETFAELKRLEIEPIADLCHFGVPDWIGDFQNPDFPEHFAFFAEEFAKRYSWVRFYTPVNEIYVCARFSAQLGWWNECLQSDKAFVTALKHLVRANILAEEAILQHQPRASFIQSESTEHFHAEEPSAFGRAAFLNQTRFLSLDLCYGMDVSAAMLEYLLDCGMTRSEYHWFLEHGSRIKPYCIMGNDYYITNEHLVPADPIAPARPAGDMFGYYVITKRYFERYHMPVMHTETNQRSNDDRINRESEAPPEFVNQWAPAWLRKQWANMVHLKEEGVPIIGFTWYSLIDQVDWDTALREDNGRVNPLGLYDIHRRIRPVGEAYRELVERWRDILPMESLGLDLCARKE